MPRLRLKRKTVFIIAFVAAVLVGAGLWAWRAWERAKGYAKVTVSEAVSWQHLGWGSNRGPSQVTITLETPYHSPYADAEVVIETWTDNCGRDLLLSALRTAYVGRYTYETWVFADKGSSGGGSNPVIVPRPNSSTPRKIAWTIGSPVEVSPDAASMKVKGCVQFREGRDPQSVRIETADIRVGKSFRLGNAECEVVGISGRADELPGAAVTFRSSNCERPWLSVRFIDRNGNEAWPTDRNHLGYDRGRKVQMTIDEPLVRVDEVICPPLSSLAAIVVESWSQVWTTAIPFDVTVPLARETPLESENLVQSPTKLIRLPSIEDQVRIERVPDEAWGPRVDESPTDLVTVIPGEEEETHANPSRLAVLRVKMNKPAISASYDFTVTGFSDSEGNQLFRPRPIRSSVRSYSTMTCERYWRSIGSDESADGQTYIPSWIEIMTLPLPSSKATSVDFEGFVKLKVMDSFKTLDIENDVIDNKTTYTVGPVQLSFGMADDKGHILVFCRGDLGLIRELEFLAQDGTLLHLEKRSIPHLYWNNMAVADVGAFDRMKDVRRLRVRYCSDYHHYVLPFKVTVPREK